MDFTFGIITDGKNDSQIREIIESIRSEDIPNYEILIIGDSHITESISRNDVRTIYNPKDEYHPIKGTAWVTRKKNIITREAKYDNIVYMHDYVKLLPGWYLGWLKHETMETLTIASNNILTLEGQRHSDWVVSPYDIWELFPEYNDNWNLLLPPGTPMLSKFMYLSGGYWVMTKRMGETFPQLEEYGWGESEDVAWSRSVRQHQWFQFNAMSTVQLMRPDKWAPGLLPTQYIDILQRFGRWMYNGGARRTQL